MNTADYKFAAASLGISWKVFKRLVLKYGYPTVADYFVKGGTLEQAKQGSPEVAKLISGRPNPLTGQVPSCYSKGMSRAGSLPLKNPACRHCGAPLVGKGYSREGKMLVSCTGSPPHHFKSKQVYPEHKAKSSFQCMECGRAIREGSRRCAGCGSYDIDLRTNPSANPKGKTAPDHEGAKELFIFIKNSGELYRQMFIPIMKNLSRKIGRGVYDKAKAVKLFMYLADEGARRYNKEYAGGIGMGIFDKPTRFLVAAQLAREFMDLYRSKEYTPEIMDLGKGKTINPFTQVRFPDHSSRLFRDKRSGRWSKFPKRRNPLDFNESAQLMELALSYLERAKHKDKRIRIENAARAQEIAYTVLAYEKKAPPGTILDSTPMARDIVFKCNAILGDALHSDNPLTISEAASIARYDKNSINRAKGRKRDAPSIRSMELGYAFGAAEAMYRAAGRNRRIIDTSKNLDAKAFKLLRNPAQRPVRIGRRVLRVEYLDEGKAKRLGMKKPGTPWRHDFTTTGAEMFGLPNGSVLIQAPKKKLWGYR